MYVCMYVYIYICICVYIYVYMYICVYIALLEAHFTLEHTHLTRDPGDPPPTHTTFPLPFSPPTAAGEVSRP